MYGYRKRADNEWVGMQDGCLLIEGIIYLTPFWMRHSFGAISEILLCEKWKLYTK